MNGMEEADSSGGGQTGEKEEDVISREENVENSSKRDRDQDVSGSDDVLVRRTGSSSLLERNPEKYSVLKQKLAAAKQELLEMANAEDHHSGDDLVVKQSERDNAEKERLLKDAAKATRNALRLTGLLAKYKEHSAKLQGFMFTTSEPRIFYRPAQHNSATNARAEDCKREFKEECERHIGLLEDEIEREKETAESNKRKADEI